jgi:hypothetical protein
VCVCVCVLICVDGHVCVRVCVGDEGTSLCAKWCLGQCLPNKDRERPFPVSMLGSRGGGFQMACINSATSPCSCQILCVKRALFAEPFWCRSL